MPTKSNAGSAPSKAKGKKRPSIRDQQKTLTRERLLEGAVTVLNENGYAAATIDEIVAESGASRATFYLHFKNKLEVLEALLAELQPRVDLNFQKLDAVLADGSRADLRLWLGDLLAWYAENEGVILAVEQAIDIEGNNAPNLTPTNIDRLPLLRSRWPQTRELEVSLRVWLLVKLLTRVFVMWRVDQAFAEVDEETMLNVLSDLYVAGLRMDPENEK
jgi:AcrR family transcriptional regulator